LTDLQAPAEPTPLRTALAWWCVAMGAFVLVAVVAFLVLALWRAIRR
jgi:type VI protein secretion system component VasF